HTLSPPRDGRRAGGHPLLPRHSARRAARVLTAASWVKRRLVEAYGVRAEDVDVIPLAPAPDFAAAREAGEEVRLRRAYGGIQAPYVLFVGKLSGRHAIADLMRAFARARPEAVPSCRLVLVGPNVLDLDLRRLADRAGLAAGSWVHVPH